jgi:undecaprenyl phosphate N,N'-diacetylbacillosamine 1-phosphate transferase
MHIYHDFFKRLFDLLVSIVVLIVITPLFLPVLLLEIVLYNGHPFFIQSRPGKDEKEIKVIKFKTMTDEKDTEGNLLPNNLRMTRSGRFLRKYSIDELPQLLNVIKGDMSLVGPRPLLFKYIPLYSSEQRKRHLVKPGITGWAQVNGRNAISWTRKFELDLFYVDNISFFLDLKILWMTVLKALKSEGINAGENVTMPSFNGKN